MIKLSILLLAHNAELTIERAIKSILSQTCKDYQILIGTDGSTDNTLLIARRYEMSNPGKIKVFEERNYSGKGGDHANFKNLMDHVDAPYFCVLDGDDYYIDNDKFKKQLDFLEKNIEFSICGHNYYIEDASQNLNLSCDCMDRYPCTANNFREVIRGGYVPYMQTSTLIYRNLKQISPNVYSKFEKSIYYSGDWIRTLIHSQYGKAKMLTDVMSVYSYNPLGDWQSRKKNEIEKFYIKYYIYHINNTFNPKNKLITVFILKQHIRNYLSLIMNYFLVRAKLILSKINFFVKKLKKSGEQNLESKSSTEIINYGQISYSQFGEDVLVARLFYNLDPGHYIDIGAHHPYRFSNTRLLYERGWRGMNIDATPGSMELFNCENSEDINLEIGVANSKSTAKFYIYADKALNSFDSTLIQEYERRYGVLPVKILDIECDSVMDIIEHNYPYSYCDYLNIDIEGMDYLVLNQFDLTSVYRPKIISCEIGFPGTVDSEIDRYLVGNGYVLLGRCLITGIYCEHSFALSRGFLIE